MGEAIIQTALTGCVSAVVGAVVGAVVAAVKAAGRNAMTEDRAMQDGMRALLWRELKNIHAVAMANGGMTIADRRHLENVYGAYHGIGGNGTGTRLYQDAMSAEIIE